MIRRSGDGTASNNGSDDDNDDDLGKAKGSVANRVKRKKHRSYAVASTTRDRHNVPLLSFSFEKSTLQKGCNGDAAEKSGTSDANEKGGGNDGGKSSGKMGARSTPIIKMSSAESLKCEKKERQKTQKAALNAALSLLPPCYKTQRKIASGSYSDVWRAIDNDTDIVYAVKTVDTGSCSASSRGRHSAEYQAKRAANEDTLWAKLSHQNLLPRYITYVRESHRATLMPHCNGGDLFYHMENNLEERNSYRFSDIRDAQHVVCQVFRALDYLHNTMLFVHRDVKPENILVHFDSEENGVDVTAGRRPLHEARLLLGDFTFLTPIESTSDKTLTETCGTPEYIAPEIYCGSKYGCAVDCWSAGVVAFECFEGRHPYVDAASQDSGQIARCVLQRDFQPFENRDASVADFTILTGLLDKCPQTRFTARQVLNQCDCNSFSSSSSSTNSLKEIFFYKIKKWMRD